MTKQEMVNEMLKPKTTAQKDYANSMAKKMKHKDVEDKYRIWKNNQKK